MPYTITERACKKGYRWGGPLSRAAPSEVFANRVESEEEGREQLEAEPEVWEGLLVLWGAKQCYLIKRGYGMNPYEVDGDDGEHKWIAAKYDTGLGEASFTDEYSDTVLAVHGNKNIAASLKRFGRGEGLHDEEGIKLFGDIDPMDVSQGGIGDCWFVSSMAAVAEFDGLRLGGPTMRLWHISYGILVMAY